MAEVTELIRKLATPEQQDAYVALDALGSSIASELVALLKGPNHYLTHMDSKINTKYALISLLWTHGSPDQKMIALDKYIDLFGEETNKTMLIGFTSSFSQREKDPAMRTHLVNALLKFLKEDHHGRVIEQQVPWRYWLAGMILSFGLREQSNHALTIVADWLHKEDDPTLPASILVTMGATATTDSKKQLDTIIGGLSPQKIKQSLIDSLRQIIQKR
jgi:hypothetical protein